MYRIRRNLNFSGIKHIHFVGIKGVAMTALAIYAKECGYHVTGSDVAEEFPTDIELRRLDIPVFDGFDIRPVHSDADLVIYTGAHGGKDNKEVVEAIGRNIPVLPQGQALGMFMEGKRQISIAGSHGKTTTTAMLATILSHAGYDPSYAVGCGEIFGLGMSGHYGQGDYFIAEADEYVTDPHHDLTARFLWQSPHILIVTNIDYDHPDVYPSLSAITDVFIHLRDKLPRDGSLIFSQDDPSSRELNWKKSFVATVGQSQESNFQVSSIRFHQEQTIFELIAEGKYIGQFSLHVPGEHNAMNAAMAVVAASRAGVPWDKIQQGLSHFRGTKRRFERVGASRGITFYDDYAHHPREIQATLQAARAWYPKSRIITIFQPHTYSRTQALLSDFAQAFEHSDIALFTEIYASARETHASSISGITLADMASRYHKHAIFAKDFSDVIAFLKTNVTSGDIIICMGAGNIYTWSKEIYKKLH